MTATEIKIDALTNWFAEDGTMCLRPVNDGGDRAPFPGYNRRTANCDNGPLFAATFYLLCRRLGILQVSDAIRFEQMERQLRVPGEAGLYDRNPGRRTDTEAFDNPLGIAVCAVLFHHACLYEIRKYGFEHGGIYNNVEPGRWSINSWRQGAELAFYDLADGSAPKVWEYLWLLIGIVVTAFQGEDRTSEHLTTLARLWALELASTQPERKAPAFFYRGVGIVGAFWFLMVHFRLGGIVRLFEIYYPTNHPNVRLARLIEANA